MENRRVDLDIVIDREMMQKLLRTGQAFDINKGGLMDARSGCVNIWCSPEDHPPCWRTEITPGGLNYPRAYVGGLYWDWVNQQDDVESWKLYIDVSPYDLHEAQKPIRGRRVLPEVAWESCTAWLKTKVQELVRLASLEPTVVGMSCPWCDWILPAGHIFNELVEHIGMAHPLAGLGGVVLGQHMTLLTVGGPIVVKEVERFD